eukprot:3911676-Rhodomonas_salina.1
MLRARHREFELLGIGMQGLELTSSLSSPRSRHRSRASSAGAAARAQLAPRATAALLASWSTAPTS